LDVSVTAGLQKDTESGRKNKNSSVSGETAQKLKTSKNRRQTLGRFLEKKARATLRASNNGSKK